MIIAYASLTGKVRNFTNRLSVLLPDLEIVKIDKQTTLDVPFVLITYTFGHGDVPNEVKSFMSRSGSNIVAVAGSGERNWGEHRFCRASIDISKEYQVPLLHNFEKMGYDTDVEIVAEKIRKIQEGLN